MNSLFSSLKRFSIPVSLVVTQCWVASCSLPSFALDVNSKIDNSEISKANLDNNFESVNQSFRVNYDNARQEILAGLGPIIICIGDRIKLCYKDREEEEVFIGEKYKQNKEIAHITLGTFVILINHVDSPLDSSVIERLNRFKSAIESSSPKLKNGTFSEKDLPRQKLLIEKTLSFMDKVLDKKSVTRAELREYCRSVSGLTLANAYIAVSEQLSTIDSIVARWKETIPEEEWKRLYVVIETRHMPREQQSTYQYFCRLLEQEREGERIITIEDADNEKQALDLLLTHILDREVAIDFYADPWRMHRDLLSDGAKKYLDKQSRLKAEPQSVK